MFFERYIKSCGLILHKDIVIKNQKEPKKLSQELYFRLSIGIPLFIAVVLLITMILSDELGKQLASIWETYKIPVTIASLSIPLAAWAIANHRSVQTMQGLKLQSHKRLYEMFYEQQNHFEKVMGRRIENAKFKYIEKDDLPVIFSELYEFNKLHQKGEVTLKPSAIEDINRFLSNTGEIIIEFYCQFIEEKEKETGQHIVLDGYIEQLLRFLQSNLHHLSNDIGVRYIELSASSIQVFSYAYSEITRLSYYMGEDFKDVWGRPLDGDGKSADEDVLNTFNAIEKIIKDYSGKSSAATYKDFQEDIYFRNIIKISQATKLQNLVRETYSELISDINLHFDLLVRVEEGVYDKYFILPKGDSGSLELWFKENSDMEGTLFLSCKLNGESHNYEVIVKILDDFVSENGKQKQKYEIGIDMGREFKSLCFAYLKKLSG
ncbi:hypothetical protein RC083_16040 [Pseudoalteromonas haloplanktis]|uniref:Uncharacterized protein n=1 Tax=Pseudoalteromonas haloplanktis TaxID=228 RepID=A0ABU1BF09_PSEHA|nr:hypothetical protein [Pseudoalteromonas haloplanktis]MDQ9093088.1 hypothetical protein [Pseudoalteromonas haloplanktis]